MGAVQSVLDGSGHPNRRSRSRHVSAVSDTSSNNGSFGTGIGNIRNKFVREHKKHGTVTLKLVNMNPVRRGSDHIITHTITPRGCILYGSSAFNPAVVQNGNNLFVLLFILKFLHTHRNIFFFYSFTAILNNTEHAMLAPTAIPLMDTRAHKILVSFCKGWHIIPFPEVFSRHSGTCLILGDRTITSPPFQIKVGDCFRLGSVGLVVSELRGYGDREQRIDAKALEFLKDEALAFDANGEMATLAADEERLGAETVDGAEDEEYEDDDNNEEEEEGGGASSGDGHSTPPRGGGSVDSRGADTVLLGQNNPAPSGLTPTQSNISRGAARRGSNCSTSIDGVTGGGGGGGGGRRKAKSTASAGHLHTLGTGGISPGERFVCYMCYESHNTEEDALVAPCDCKGDTRYLHVQCLQKWYQASINGVQTQVIRTTGNGAPACKICGSAYKTAFKRSDGRTASLLEVRCCCCCCWIMFALLLR
jgi:hypothetical protein